MTGTTGDRHPRRADAPQSDENGPGVPQPRVDPENGPQGRTARVEAACEVMHDAYEKAALGAGWVTNPQSRKPWADVPDANKETMRAAVGALLDWLAKP